MAETMRCRSSKVRRDKLVQLLQHDDEYTVIHSSAAVATTDDDTQMLDGDNVAAVLSSNES